MTHPSIVANAGGWAVAIADRLAQIPDREIGPDSFQTIQSEWDRFTETLQWLERDVESLSATVAHLVKQMARIVRRAARGPSYGEACLALKHSELGELGRKALLESSRPHVPITVPPPDAQSPLRPEKLADFIKEMNSRFADPTKRQWFQAQVISWLERPLPMTSEGALAPDPSPVWPFVDMTWDMPTQCAALAGLQCTHARKTPLFVLPEKFDEERFGSVASRQGGRWHALKVQVRLCKMPPEILRVYRAMLNHVESAWQTERQRLLGRYPDLAGADSPSAATSPQDAAASSASGSSENGDVPSENTISRKRKKSTERGEGETKLIAALITHHRYADGGSLNQEPIGNNCLARLAAVDKATASAFFKQKFKGHRNYKSVCANQTRLIAALKLLNGDFAPHILCGSTPADEG